MRSSPTGAACYVRIRRLGIGARLLALIPATTKGSAALWRSSPPSVQVWIVVGENDKFPE